MNMVGWRMGDLTAAMWCNGTVRLTFFNSRYGPHCAASAYSDVPRGALVLSEVTLDQRSVDERDGRRFFRAGPVRLPRQPKILGPIRGLLIYHHGSDRLLGGYDMKPWKYLGGNIVIDWADGFVFSEPVAG